MNRLARSSRSPSYKESPDEDDDDYQSDSNVDSEDGKKARHDTEWTQDWTDAVRENRQLNRSDILRE